MNDEEKIQCPEVPEGEVRVFQHGETPVAVFNIKGNYFALDDRCPHRAGPLSEGKIEGDTVTCPWHHFQFHIPSGRCLSKADGRPARSLQCLAPATFQA